MPWLIPSIVGFFIGGFLAVLAIGLLRMARSDEDDHRWQNGYNQGLGVALGIFDEEANSDTTKRDFGCLSFARIEVIRQAILDSKEIWE